MGHIYWSITAFDVDDNKRITYSSEFTNAKDAEQWKMSYVAKHPCDYILFTLKDESQHVLKDDFWPGHELSEDIC